MRCLKCAANGNQEVFVPVAVRDGVPDGVALGVPDLEGVPELEAVLEGVTDGVPEIEAVLEGV